MIFALPLPLPLSIRDNITYGPRMAGEREQGRRWTAWSRSSLRAAYLWDEVKDRLDMPGQKLSGGQQQRLCIARSLALEPEVILYDEPCSGLDPISTAKVEESMLELKKTRTVVLVTNNTKQAARVGDPDGVLPDGRAGRDRPDRRRLHRAPRQADGGLHRGAVRMITPKIQVQDLNLWYGDFQALIGVSADIREKAITALIGSSGCGKSTLLRCLNRMNDLIDEVRIEGRVIVDGEDIYAPRTGT